MMEEITFFVRLFAGGAFTLMGIYAIVMATRTEDAALQRWTVIALLAFIAARMQFL